MVGFNDLPVEIFERIIYYCDVTSVNNLFKCLPSRRNNYDLYFKDLNPYLGIIKYRRRIESEDNRNYFSNDCDTMISYELSKIKDFFFNFISENIENKKIICRANFFYKKIKFNERINYSKLKNFIEYRYINHELCYLIDNNYSFHYNEYYTGYIPLYNNTSYRLNFQNNDMELVMLKNDIEILNCNCKKILKIKKYLGKNKLVIPITFYSCCIFECYKHEGHCLKSRHINITYIRIFREENDTLLYEDRDTIKIKNIFKTRYPHSRDNLNEIKKKGIITNKVYELVII